MEKSELFKKAVSKWGIKAQVLMLSEECSELIHAICKEFRRGGAILANADANFYEEVADVEIMIEQIRSLAPEINRQIDIWKRNKLAILEGILDE